MDAKYMISDIKEALVQQHHPTVVMWNRLEGRPRTHNFDRSLKAEVRDAIWMLTRQWQMGEFKADDAGSPFLARVHISSTRLNKYRAVGQEVQDYEKNMPLEVKAEQKQIPFSGEKTERSIDIRLQMGRQWVKLLKKEGLEVYLQKFITEYPFKLPARDRDHGHIYAHREVWQQYASISGRCVDGYKLYRFLEANHVSDNVNLAISNTDKNEINELGDIFSEWFRTLYHQPVEEINNAWVPERLEYQFDCSAVEGGKEKVLSAEGYHHGHLDWFAFNLDAGVPGLGNEDGENSDEDRFTKTFIPSHVEFEGMPDTRWWKFEDSKTDLGDIKPSTTDLAKLLLMEFGLVYANDWFIVPFELPIGSLARIQGLAVTNNFGERFWIEPAGKGAEDWKKWSMYRLHGTGKENTAQDNLLFLAPAAAKVQEGRPLEEVRLIRDEMANMVWGVESIVPLPDGYGRNGNEAANETLQFHKNFVNETGPDPVPDYAASISYLAMTTVPENWIPFVPVHKDGDNREIQLQRSSMLRIIHGDPLDPPPKIKPHTDLLRYGLDLEHKKPYFIFEEVISRSGISVRQQFQRTRWTDGEIFVWLGAQKKTGRGEGSSGLAFDQVIDT